MRFGIRFRLFRAAKREQAREDEHPAEEAAQKKGRQQARQGRTEKGAADAEDGQQQNGAGAEAAMGEMDREGRATGKEKKEQIDALRHVLVDPCDEGEINDEQAAAPHAKPRESGREEGGKHIRNQQNNDLLQRTSMISPESRITPPKMRLTVTSGNRPSSKAPQSPPNTPGSR